MRQIHEGISACADQLESLVDEIAKAGDEAAHMEAEFKGVFAAARLKVRARANEDGRKITVDEVEDAATETTKQARLEHLLAANNLLVKREALRATQSRLDGLRSLLSSFKAAGG